MLGSRSTVRLGSSTGGVTATSGVPSTGQKLNLSANSSLHTEQNFINTTSSAPENSLAKLVLIRLSRTLEGPGATQRSSNELSSSSETNSSSGSTPISGLPQSNNFPTSIQFLIAFQIRPQNASQPFPSPIKSGLYSACVGARNLGHLAQAQPFIFKQDQRLTLQWWKTENRFPHLSRQLLVEQPSQGASTRCLSRFLRNFFHARLASLIAKVLQSEVSGSGI